MQQRPNLPLSLQLAGRGFVMGVCLGLSGIVLDPIRGILFSFHSSLKSSKISLLFWQFHVIFYVTV